MRITIFRVAKKEKKAFFQTSFHFRKWKKKYYLNWLDVWMHDEMAFIQVMDEVVLIN